MQTSLNRLLAVVCFFAWVMPSLAQQPLTSAAVPGEGFTSPQAKEYVADAIVIGGEDLQADVARMCRVQPVQPMVGPPPPAGTIVPPPKPRVARPAYEPNKIFDNVYFFGTSEVGATVIRTTAGLVLIDTLTTSEDAERVLVGGMKKEGLNPADIRYVIVTHAHGDHHGGIKFLREHYPKFKVVMSANDWAFATKPFYMPDGNPDWAPKPPRARGDIAYKDSYDLEVGDTMFHLIETPGHTPGTTSLLYNIRNGGHSETVVQWGGGGPMNSVFSLATVERFVRVAKAAKPSIQWSSHAGPAFWGISGGPGFSEKAAAAQSSSPESNPFIAGQDKVGRFLDIVVACKRAVVADDAKF